VFFVERPVRDGVRRVFFVERPVRDGVRRVSSVEERRSRRCETGVLGRGGAFATV
jgi:hypothetical protein